MSSRVDALMVFVVVAFIGAVAFGAYRFITAPTCGPNELSITDDLGKYVCVSADKAAVIRARVSR